MSEAQNALAEQAVDAINAIAGVERGPAALRLVVQLAEDGDPVDEPTAAWPDERQTVVAGRLEVTDPELERERRGEVLVFDPTRVCDGIQCSDDPVLRFRTHAYSVSVERRSTGDG
jgi:catalase